MKSSVVPVLPARVRLSEAAEQWDLPYDLGASETERAEIRDLIDRGEPVPTTYGDPLYPFGFGLSY